MSAPAPLLPSRAQLQAWGEAEGFSQIGVSDVDLRAEEPSLQAWLDAGWHATMHYMQAHGLKRARPAELRPGTLSIVTAWMDYLPAAAVQPDGREWTRRELARLLDPDAAVVSVYARGRDYHRVLRQRLNALAARMAQAVGPFGYRVFTDSAPVLEVALATRSGIGWRGKHTLALRRDAGSAGFLGEIFTDLPLPADHLQRGEPDHCGRCSACLAVCPTTAIVAPYRLDARRCLSYLTIEHDGPFPQEHRAALGNRLYGCDDCQLACPWNRFAQPARLADFDVRHGLDRLGLVDALGWTAAEFDERLAGSAIRRIGYWRWRRNLAVVSGNALRGLTEAAAQRLAAEVEAARRADARAAAPDWLDEHWAWALGQTDAADGEGA